MNQIVFINNERDIVKYLEEKLGLEAANLYRNVSKEMEKEFFEKYYKDINSYGGFRGIMKKATNYKRIDYRSVYKLIEQYKSEQQTDKKEGFKRR